MGGSAYNRFRVGKTGGVQSQDSKDSCSGIVGCSDRVAHWCPLARPALVLPRLNNSFRLIRILRSAQAEPGSQAMPRLYKRMKEGIRLLGVGRSRRISLASLTCDCFVYMVVLIQNKERANGTRNTGTNASL